jgi:hypothetical protein
VQYPFNTGLAAGIERLSGFTNSGMRIGTCCGRCHSPNCFRFVMKCGLGLPQTAQKFLESIKPINGHGPMLAGVHGL